jgi:hypothetical protein
MLLLMLTDTQQHKQQKYLMPRGLSSAASGKESNQIGGVALGVRKPSANTILIVVVLLAFLWTSGGDAYARVKDAQH